MLVGFDSVPQANKGVLVLVASAKDQMPKRARSGVPWDEKLAWMGTRKWALVCVQKREPRALADSIGPEETERIIGLLCRYRLPRLMTERSTGRIAVGGCPRVRTEQKGPMMPNGVAEAVAILLPRMSLCRHLRLCRKCKADAQRN